MEGKRVAIIGLDCWDPVLVEKWRDDLPHIKSLQENGVYGKLRSTDPPITIPAWSSMMSGKSPGTLGFYGFRNRSDYSYDKLSFATSHMVREKRLWDILSDAGKKVIILGVPQTYPPKAVNGILVGDFLAPDTKSDYTYPKALKEEIERVVGDYMLDVDDFRTENKERLLRDIYRMTKQHFDLARHFVTTREWDFFMMVDMGPDRIHHGFWKFFDPAHPKYVAGNPLETSIRDYYTFVDGEVGKLIEVLPADCAVIVVSDHGAQPMIGGVAINEWLIEKGYLTLLSRPETPTKIGSVKIDWQNTRAWGEGGYYSRLFFNVKGREPEGTIDPADYEAFRDRMIEEITAMTDERGAIIGNVCLRPEDLYREARGIPPDLFIYFGNLAWRSVGTVGLGSYITYENDTGPDDANHSFFGYVSVTGTRKNGVREGLSIFDVAPTVLTIMGMPTFKDMEGKIIE